MAEQDTTLKPTRSLTGITPGTQLLVSLGGLDERLKTVFVGLEKGRHFMFRTPRTALGTNLYDHLYTGNRVVVRFLHYGHIWAFGSRIQAHVAKPHPLVFIDYPETVQTHNLRKEHRIDCFFPATLMQGETRWRGMIQDLSRAGCALTYDASARPVPPQVGDIVHLHCPLFKAVDQDQIRCDVRRVEGGQDEPFRLGVTFADLPEPVETWIGDYVDQALLVLDH
ncbi:flagellar brake protein [Desulfocurvus sp. DL9XJH121]